MSCMWTEAARLYRKTTFVRASTPFSGEVVKIERLERILEGQLIKHHLFEKAGWDRSV